MSHPLHRITLPTGSRDTRHDAFAVGLRLSRVGSPRWQRYWAGALVLQLAEEALSRERHTAFSDREYLDVRRAIAVLRPDATRACLHAILDGLIGGSPEASRAVDALSAYAARLEHTGEFGPAANVYTFVIEIARNAGLADRLPYAHLRLGSCFRELGQMSLSVRAYDAGLSAAALYRDRRTESLLHIARARLHQVNQRLEVARAILDEVLATPDVIGSPDLRALAAHNRGVVAHQMGMVSKQDSDFFAAIEYLGIALHTYTQREQRARALNDLGRCLFHLGRRVSARRASHAAFLSATDRANKWACGNNLIMIAVADGDRDTFEAFRVMLARSPMPGPLRVENLLEVSEGHFAFGAPDLARHALRRAARLARRLGLASHLREAEEGLAEGGWTKKEPRTPPEVLPAAVREVEDAILTLRYQSRLIATSVGDSAFPSRSDRDMLSWSNMHTVR